MPTDDESDPSRPASRRSGCLNLKGMPTVFRGEDGAPHQCTLPAEHEGPHERRYPGPDADTPGPVVRQRLRAPKPALAAAGRA